MHPPGALPDLPQVGGIRDARLLAACFAAGPLAGWPEALFSDRALPLG